MERYGEGCSAFPKAVIVNFPTHYEFLQISPNAEADTIHRVFRFLAARFHPDNPETGDTDKFRRLKQAYDVLSHPFTRTAYDTSCSMQVQAAPPLSSTIDFMDSIEGETNRRLAVLALLYFRRRTSPDKPEVSLFELEERMGFPRDYLDFTVWYLHKKSYITRSDNADLTLTASGVDFVETQRVKIPVLNKLLTPETGLAPAGVGSAAPFDAPSAPAALASAAERRARADRRGTGDRRKRA